MSLGAILSAAGLAAALSLTTGQAEVLAFNSTSAINGMAMVSDPPVIDGFGEADDVNEARGEEFEVQSDLERGTLTVTVTPESTTWATMLLGFAGFGR
jgi:hypothetical protein